MNLLKKMLAVRGVGNVQGFGARRLMTVPELSPYTSAGSGRTVKTGGLTEALELLHAEGFRFGGVRGYLMRESERTKLGALPTNAQLQTTLDTLAGNMKVWDGYAFELSDYESLMAYGGDRLQFGESVVLELWCNSHVELDLSAIREASGIEEITLSPYGYAYGGVNVGGQVPRGRMSWTVSFDMVEGMSISVPTRVYEADIVFAEEPRFTAGKHYVMVMTWENKRIYVDWREYAIN